jgi:hypothetical protein
MRSLRVMQQQLASNAQLIEQHELTIRGLKSALTGAQPPGTRTSVLVSGRVGGAMGLAGCIMSPPPPLKDAPTSLPAASSPPPITPPPLPAAAAAPPADRDAEAGRLRDAVARNAVDAPALAAARSQLATAQRQLDALRVEAKTAVLHAEAMERRGNALQVGGASVLCGAASGSCSFPPTTRL